MEFRNVGRSNLHVSVANHPTNAVPEPASLTLLGLGTFGLMGYAWRRKQAALASR